MCFCHGRPAIVCSHCGLWFLTHFVVGLAFFTDWQYRPSLGAPQSCAYGLAIDSQGPVVVGSASGGYYSIFQGGTDCLSARFTDAGTLTIGARQWGEPDEDIARSVAVDANDNIWSAGWTGGPSARAPIIFKMVPPSYTLDIFDRPSSSGTAFLGGITIDSSGNVIAVGGSTGTIDGFTSSGDYDFLLMVYSNAGVKQFTRLTGSSAQDDAYSVTTDSSDNIVVLGETSGSMSGFTNAGVGDDVAVLKYDSSGTLLWTYQWGSASDDWFKCVKTDSSDNIYAAGITAGTLTGANAGGYDVGVFKLNSAAVQQWVVQRGSAGTDQALGMALDLTNGLLYVSGFSDGELDGRTNPTASAAFVMVFDLGGTWQSTSFIQGAFGSSEGWGVVLTASLDLILAGSDGGVYSVWKILTTSTTTTISSSSTTFSTSSTVSSSSTTSSTSSTVSSSSTTSSTTSTVSSSSTTMSSTTLSTSSTISSSSTTRSITSSSKTKTSTSSTETGSSTTSRSQTISSTTSSSATNTTRTSSSTSATSTSTSSTSAITTTATRTSTTTSTTSSSSSISFTTSLFFTNSSSGSTTRTSSTRNTHSVSSTSVSASSTRTINRAASTTLMMNSTATSTPVSPATLPLTDTSAVTVTSARNVASEVLLKFEENQKDLVQQLLENAANGETGVPVSTEEPDGTLVFGVAMSVPENATDRVTVSAPNGLSLGVPTTLLAAAGGSVALSVAQLGQDSKMVQALEALDEEELTIRLAARPVSVVLFSADGREWSGPLPAPLELVIPVVENQTEDGKVGACAFWDLEVNMWSTEGVTTLSISDGLVTCETRHLSLFGFVLRTIGNIFACSAAVAIFSLDGLKNLVKGGMWMRSIPALMHWAVVLVAGIFLFASWRCDKKHERYLKELKQASEAHRFQQRLRLQRLQRRSSSMQFASLKQLLPEEIIALRLPKVLRFSKHFYSMLVRQETGQTLADLEGLHSSVGLVAAHVKAYNSIIRFCSSSALGKANTLYTANNAWIRWSEPSPVSSCVFRCLLHFALLYSKWAVAAVFFNFSARAADENCQAFFQLSPEMIIRSVFVSTLSTLLGIVPFLLLVLLSKCPREPKCFTRVGNLIAFAYVWLYAVTCIMVVSIFLSSVHLDDAWKWFVTGFMGFISSLLLIPVILMSLGLTLLTFYQVDPDDLCSWRKEGRLLPLRLQISIPPETLSLLLQQINGAEHLLVVCAVAGIPEKTVTLQKTGSAEWSSSQPFSIRDRQKLQISFLAQTGVRSSELGSISLESEKWKGSHRRLPLIPSLDPSLEAFVDVEIVEIASEVERDRMDDGMEINMVVDVVGDDSNLTVPETEVVDFVDMEDLVSEEGIKTARV